MIELPCLPNIVFICYVWIVLYWEKRVFIKGLYYVIHNRIFKWLTDVWAQIYIKQQAWFDSLQLFFIIQWTTVYFVNCAVYSPWLLSRIVQRLFVELKVNFSLNMIMNQEDETRQWKYFSHSDQMKSFVVPHYKDSLLWEWLGQRHGNERYRWCYERNSLMFWQMWGLWGHTWYSIWFKHINYY